MLDYYLIILEVNLELRGLLYLRRVPYTLYKSTISKNFHYFFLGIWRNVAMLLYQLENLKLRRISVARPFGHIHAYFSVEYYKVEIIILRKVE